MFSAAGKHMCAKERKIGSTGLQHVEEMLQEIKNYSNVGRKSIKLCTFIFELQVEVQQQTILCCRTCYQGRLKTGHISLLLQLQSLFVLELLLQGGYYYDDYT